MRLHTTKQATLPFSHQAAVVDLATRQYPDAVDSEEIPLLIALPAGISPYNKSGGYYVPRLNYIVMYQRLGRRALGNKIDLMLIAHELAHWYQCRSLDEKGEGKTNSHRRKSWMDACFVATQNLWPELNMERWQFDPYKSVRVPGTGVRKEQREGALTDIQLHAWPRSLSEFTGQAVGLVA